MKIDSLDVSYIQKLQKAVARASQKTERILKARKTIEAETKKNKMINEAR